MKKYILTITDEKEKIFEGYSDSEDILCKMDNNVISQIEELLGNALSIILQMKNKTARGHHFKFKKNDNGTIAELDHKQLYCQNLKFETSIDGISTLDAKLILHTIDIETSADLDEYEDNGSDGDV